MYCGHGVETVNSPVVLSEAVEMDSKESGERGSTSETSAIVCSIGHAGANALSMAIIVCSRIWAFEVSA